MNDPKQECCEACKSDPWADPIRTFYVCKDPPCPCHSNSEEWEKQFDEQFTIDCSSKTQPSIPCRHFKSVDDANAVKSFIHRTRQEAKRERDREVVEMIDGMYQTEKRYNQNTDKYELPIEDVAYNAALSDLRSRLSE